MNSLACQLGYRYLTRNRLHTNAVYLVKAGLLHNQDVWYYLGGIDE